MRQRAERRFDTFKQRGGVGPAMLAPAAA